MAATLTYNSAPAYSRDSLGSQSSHISFAPEPLTVAPGQFAFARIKGDVHLVQGTTTPASSSVVDVKIFRHEFITIFRFSHQQSLHAADIHIIEPIDESLTRYEEDNETVFLARDVVDRLRRMTERKRFGQYPHRIIQKSAPGRRMW